MTDRKTVLVIGGGLAGLTAALHLAERGLHPIVLEADPEYPGGRVVEVDGWQFRGEHGVHGIWSPYRNLQGMLARHNIRPMFVPALEEEWIYKAGNRVKRASVGTTIRYSPIPAPLHYLALFLKPSFLRMLGLRDWLSLPFVWGGLVWGLGVDPLAENQPLGEMTLKDIIRWWGPAVSAFMIGLTRNGLSGRPEEIPLSGYIAFIRFYTVMRRDSWIFSYMPADGGTSLIDPLVKTLTSLGGEVRLGQRVTEIRRGGESWEVVTEGGKTRTWKAGQIVLGTDARSTRKLIDSSPDLKAAGNEFYWPPSRETVIVRLWYRRTPNAGAESGIFTGDFKADNFFWLHRLQDQYRNWHKATGGSAIEVHFYGPPEILAMDDVSLLALAITDVQAAFPELRGHLVHQVLQRNQASHTLFGLGSVEQHLGIETRWENIFACGDWVRDPIPPLFLERATATGILAANQVLARNGLEPWPLIPYPPPEAFTGFIQKIMRRGRRNRRLKRSAAPAPEIIGDMEES
ncbi:MAG: FAD-dependent oxidoreductase [Anaerolineales bacterium]